VRLLSWSSVDPAREEAARQGLSFDTVQVDFEKDPVPPGPWDVILVFHYLHRPFFGAFPQLLAPGGLLLFCQATWGLAARPLSLTKTWC
jgi:hypothetical protein